MKCFKYLAVPGVDKIGSSRPAERFYKLISSAAYNWDKPLVMSETYGDTKNISWDMIYTVAMEQYTKGINQLIPHAIWYNDGHVTYRPELSWRNPLYADGLPQYNKYMSRLNLMLQNHGRHVADIAVLYPIATLQAGHRLDGPLGSKRGGVTVPEADYVDVGELLAVGLGRDYTFIHPEVLHEKCSLQGHTLVLDNKVNREQYKVLIVPGHKTIAWNSLNKIKQFYDNGGKIIATGILPAKSAEFGHDADVQRTIEALFPDRKNNGPRGSKNAAGGAAVFLPRATSDSLRKALDNALSVYDVEFEPGKELRYIHKVVGDRQIFFFANLQKRPLAGRVQLRGRIENLEAWNPHTGKIVKLHDSYTKEAAVDITQFSIELAPIESVFVIGN